ncbi:MAG: hypothetical protein COB76_05720 [Alphaproteobacteria bacterium]|nr:MAG: hypothetical protein COB76_05720 [Alphaproteobacteria bacterium]
MTKDQKHQTSTVTLPTFQAVQDRGDHEALQIFTHAFRNARQGRDEIKVLSAIHKTADITGQSDAFISKILVEHGLLAPRLSFPQDFLDHIDQSFIRQEEGRFSILSKSYRSVLQFWSDHGEDPFAFVRRGHKAYQTPSFLTA